MSALQQMWDLVFISSALTAGGAAVFLLSCDLRHTGPGGRACLRTLPRSTRWWYHHVLQVYPVASLLGLLGDGVEPLDPVWLFFVGAWWWCLRKHDHWDDEDRDAVSRALWGRVERFGNRLRVAPATGS